MSDNEKKLPSKNLKIALFVVFALVATAIAMFVQTPSKVSIPQGQQAPNGAR